MFAVIYRWKIKPEFERQFIESWSKITEYYLTKSGALGSRLHRGDDGLFYAYAQWETADSRTRAFQNISDIAAREKLKQAIEESFPEITLNTVADFLTLPVAK